MNIQLQEQKKHPKEQKVTSDGTKKILKAKTLRIYMFDKKI